MREIPQINSGSIYRRATIWSWRKIASVNDPTTKEGLTLNTKHDTYRKEVDAALLQVETGTGRLHLSVQCIGVVFSVMAHADDFGLSSYEIGSAMRWTTPNGDDRYLETPLDMYNIRDCQHILLSLRDPYCNEVYMPPRGTHMAKRLKSTIEYLLRTYTFSDSTIKILKKKKDRCKQILAEEPGMTDEEVCAEVEQYSKMKF